MRTSSTATLLLASVGVAAAQDDTGRDLLFSDPSANLPDVKISDSVKYVNEGSSFYYTVELTHVPGMREDQTIDLANDEVRIYLSSSQEVYQQGTASATATTADDFVQKLGHRTQLVIDTNVVKCDVTTKMGRYTDPACFAADGSTAGAKLTDGYCLNTETGVTTTTEKSGCVLAKERFTPTTDHVMGPLPYVYVPYSTKNPTQPSTVTATAGAGSEAGYNVVCPLCTHSKFCTMDASDIIVGSDTLDGVPAGADDTNFDGCLKVTYNGFAPAYDACFAGNGGAAPAATTAISGDAPETIAAAANRIKVGTGGASLTTGATNVDTISHCFNIPQLDFDGKSYVLASGVKTLLLEPTPMGRGFLDEEDATNYPLGVLSPPLAAGGVGADATDLRGYFAEETSSASTTLMPGNSDFRITASGEHAKRRVKDYTPYCRYCELPGIKCHNKDGGSTGQVSNTADLAAGVGYAQACPDIEVNGGDTAPGSCARDDTGAITYSDGTNFGSSEFTSKYDCEAASTTGAALLFTWNKDTALWRGWRGDVSSGAQLVFDSTNWNIAQTVKVTARDDDVYEPEVFGRGQDAYVHHFVVAQDENLQHTYYDDIDVNSLTVSITDNDSPVVLETTNSLTPTELATYGAPSALTPMAANAVAAAHSTGCTDPQHKDYNKCLAASSCTGACNGITADASQEGGTADKCLVSFYATQAACEAPATGQCFVDALGSALADNTAYSTEALCEGTDGTSTAGTCAGSGPSAATTCSDSTLSVSGEVGGTGSACTTKSTCEAAGFVWHSHGYVWIGATEASTLTWATNTWGGVKTGATTVTNAADEIVLQLSSEPMYDVTVYVQSGAFFTTDSPTSVDHFQPDDEQVIFQDKGQATTCVLAASGLASNSAGVLSSNRATGTEGVAAAASGHSVATPCVADATTVPMCDPQGYFVSSQQYLDRRAFDAGVVALPLAAEGLVEGLSPGANTPSADLADASVDDHPGAITGPERGLSATGFTGQKLPTKGHDLQSCRTLTTEADCVAATNSGCAWASNKCTLATPVAAMKLTAKDLVCASLGQDEATCNLVPGCAWDGRSASSGCVAHRAGYDCNSFLTFSSTNWNVPQTLMAIAVADDDDETPSGTCTSSAGIVDYSITTSAACTAASKTWTADTEPANTGATPYGVDTSEIGYLVVSDDYYYNSAGAELIDDAKSAYRPVVDGVTGYCTTTATGLIDYSKTTEADCDTGAGRTQTWQYTGPAAGVSLSMFDTRFGDHINRYPFTLADKAEYGASGTKYAYDHAAAPNAVSWNGNDRAYVVGDDSGSERVGCAAVAYATATTVVTLEAGQNAMRGGERGAVTSGEVRYGCPIGQGVQGTASYDATGDDTDDNFATSGNKVCLNKDGYFDGGAAHSSVQVTAFSPASYAADGVTCGATSYTQDKNARGVVISRSMCEVTEGRRHYYSSATNLNRHAANMLENPGSLGNQLGLLMPYTAAMDDWAFSRALAQSAVDFTALDASGVGTFDDTTAVAFKVGDQVVVDNGSVGGCDSTLCSSYPCTVVITALTLDRAATSTMTLGTVVGGSFSGLTAMSATSKCAVSRAALAKPQDGWSANWATAVDGGSGAALTATLATYAVSNAVMSQPVCPFTIALTSAPAEGATVVVKVGEDENLASLRDNELYFYEEPTFRLSETAGTGTACGTDNVDCGATGPYSIVTPSSAFKVDGTVAENLALTAVACERSYPGSVTVLAGETDEIDVIGASMCYINNVGSAVDEAVVLASATGGASGTAKVVIAPGATDVWGLLSAMEKPKQGDTIQISLAADDKSCDIAGTYTLQADPTCVPTAGPPATYSCTEFFTDQPLVTMADASGCALSKPYRPNGGTSINVKFTDDDWNVPRRITVIALNDDVDEPLDTRKVYFTKGWSATGTWQGVGSGPGIADADCENCVEDPFWRDVKIGTIGTLSLSYAGPAQYTATGQYEVGSTGGTAITGTAIVETPITIDVIDDDIADLVVLCGAGGGMPGVHDADGVPAAAADGHGMAQTESLDFIGSYDDALDPGEANEIKGLEIDGTINRIGSATTLGLGGKVFKGGVYGGTGGTTAVDWVPDVTTVGATAVTNTETITLASGKGALFAVGDRIKLAACGATAAALNGYHTVTAVNGDALTFAEGAAGYVMNAATFVPTDGEVATCTVQGAVKREAYEAEDGLAQGVQNSFGGGIIKVTAAVDVLPAAQGGKLTTRQSVTSSILCSKYTVYTAATGVRDDTATAAACATEAALQDGCVISSAACVGGTATGTADNTFYTDTYVDWTTYDPYQDKYLKSDGYTPTNQGVMTKIASAAASMDEALLNGITHSHHNRGFKGVGPALTEGADNYACTIHTRECEYDPPKGAGITHGESGFCYTIADNEITADASAACTGATKAWGYYKDSSDIDADNIEEGSEAYGTVDVGDEACHNKNVGSFKIRLNSSPGQKTVKRQYIGETSTVYEKELVYIVVTPDATAQTQFVPASVTFTETGGLVNGVATQRWDKPATVEVRPVDDKVDERRGVTVDFTAFSITQSHETDDYWTYATPYMNIPVSPDAAATSGTCDGTTELGYCADSTFTCATGSTANECAEKCKTTCVAAGHAFIAYPATGSAHSWGDAAAFRAEEHTPYRHTIRTVHTLDNDYAGVTVTQPTSSGTDLDYPEDQTAGLPGTSFAVSVTEGGSFGYYTLQLDSQPALIQRQAGTSPNKDIAFSSTCDHDGAATDQVFKAEHCDVQPGTEAEENAAATTCTLTAAAASAGSCAVATGSGQCVYVAPGYADSFDGANFGDYYYDNTKLMRTSATCGSVVPSEYYWVDVTATQTIQLDLATPPSCPTVAPWGGGSSTDAKASLVTYGFVDEHHRFPYNGKDVSGGSVVEPYDEVNHRGVAMDNYLTTCGGWQRDATYRFTAKDWDVPQYVYFYAHNDKDGVKAVTTGIDPQVLSGIDAAIETRTLTTADPAAAGFAVGDRIEVDAAANACAIAGHYTIEAVSSTAITVAEPIRPTDGTNTPEDTEADCQVQRHAVTGGTDGIGAEVLDGSTGYYATTIKHYVETEDTLDNMAATTGITGGSPIAAAAATADPAAGKTLTVAVDASYGVGDRVRIVENSVGTDCDAAVGEYTISAIATDRSTVTFLEAIGATADHTHCSLISSTGRCTDQGTQTTAQKNAASKSSCTAAGGQWTPAFVQRNKHGGIYTYGNLERYPFGRQIPYTDSQNALAFHHETGFTTYGYTSYETLYGYTAAGAIDNAAPSAYDTASTAGQNIGSDCGPTEMSVTTQTQASALWAASSEDQPGGLQALADKRLGTGSVTTNTYRSKFVEPGTTTVCVNMFGHNAPYQHAKRGLPCVPAAIAAAAPTDDTGAAEFRCVPRFAENGGTTGVAGFPTDGTATKEAAIILAAAGSGDRSGATGTGGGYEEANAMGTALNNPPKDVVARVTDNDDITEQATAAVAGCRATSLFQYADSVGTAGGQQTDAVGGRGVFKKEWLTDYNCDSGDAGGLPGYPLSPTRGDGTAITGYCTDGVQATEALCTAVYFCTVAGKCSGTSAPTTATVEGECGTCATTSGQPTATNRFTQAECIKDSDGDNTADGVWTTGNTPGWSATDASEANCASVLGGVWKARTWIAAPTGDATTGWLPVKAAQAAVVASSLVASSRTFLTGSDQSSAFAVGDRVTVDAEGANTCADSSCPICGTYHIATVATNDLTFVEAFTSTATGVPAHCEVARPAVTLDSLDNKQCCSCVPATGSTVAATTLAVHKTESDCTTDSAGARLGGTWVCSGVGPFCTAD